MVLLAYHMTKILYKFSNIIMTIIIKMEITCIENIKSLGIAFLPDKAVEFLKLLEKA